MIKSIFKLKNLVLSALLASVFFAADVYADGVTVIIDGVAKDFSVAPIVVSDRVMLPIRDTFEAIGASVEWNDETSEATAVKGEKTVVVKPGSCELVVNGEKLVMDVPAHDMEDRLFIPVRFAAQAFDCTVLWNEETSTVSIYTAGDFNFYPEANVPVYSDIIPSSALVDESVSDSGEKIYTYKTSYEDITEYLMALQEKFGFEYYSADFSENGSAMHIYANADSKDIVSLTCGDNAEHGYVAVVIPSSHDESRRQTQTSEPPQAQVPSFRAPEADIAPPAEEPSAKSEYYENTENTLPTYTDITGMPLVEKVTEDNVDIYKYSDGFMGMMQYTMAITFYCGYREYSSDLDFNTITRYYTNGETIVGIAGSLFTNEVWIMIPREE